MLRYNCICVCVCVSPGMSTVFDGSREDYFPDLLSWAHDNGASCDSFTVGNFGAEGYGLRATRDIKVSSRGGGPQAATTLWAPRGLLC